eukprot:86105_1
MSLFSLSAFWILHVLTEEVLKKMSATAVLSTTHSLSVTIEINEKQDVININLSGPTDVYFAVGFGSNVMKDTWTIIVNGEGENGWCERTLSNHGSGIQSETESFKMLENKYVHSDTYSQLFLRRLHIQKSLTSLESYHPFNIDDNSINVIWAIGMNKELTKHVEYGTKALYYITDGIANKSKNPGDIWIHFGDMDLSAMIIVIGLGCLFLSLFIYGLCKFYSYLKRRAHRRMEYISEKDPLLIKQFDGYIQ